jgi:hypothetical protein
MPAPESSPSDILPAPADPPACPGYTPPMSKFKIRLIVASVVGAALLGAGLYSVLTLDTVEVEREVVAPSEPEELLQDDRLEDKQPAFDDGRVHPRPVGGPDAPWQVNLSASVLRLDVPDTRSDEPDAMRRLFASYREAAEELEAEGYSILPSVNMVAGKAKQFDDGLMAALDAWAVSNREQGIRDLEVLLRQVLSRLHPTTDAYAWVWAALEVGGLMSLEEQRRRPPRAPEFMSAFLSNDALSRPVGFYNWSEDLQRIFRFLRFLQQPFASRGGVPDALARVFARDDYWLERYQGVLRFYARLSGPADAVSIADLAGPEHADRPLSAIAEHFGHANRNVYFLPPSGTREGRLFRQLYPMGAPEHAELMRDFILALRDGRLDLTPDANDGWYAWQMYAQVPFALPERSPENERLMLTRKYKQRLLEAFRAGVTMTRETHIRTQPPVAVGSDPTPADPLQPRLRVEPNPEYFLRTARSYGFLQQFLIGAVEDLNDLVGYRRGGWRSMPLGDELEMMRLRFYGLYLVSCEDIGQAPVDLVREIPDAELCKALAVEWLENWRDDPDMAADIRIGVPVLVVPGESMRLWCTLGVRPMHLEAEYVRPPSWRPAREEGAEWQEVQAASLKARRWVILSSEQAEVTRPTDVPLTRKELRDVCDQHQTREAIIAALSR